MNKEKYATQSECYHHSNPSNHHKAAIIDGVRIYWENTRTNANYPKLSPTYKYKRPCNPRMENTATSIQQ